MANDRRSKEGKLHKSAVQSKPFIRDEYLFVPLPLKNDDQQRTHYLLSAVVLCSRALN